MTERFLFNVTVEYRSDATGRKLLLPGLANENNDLVHPLLRYSEYLKIKGYSQTHLSKLREAVRLFYEYSFVNTPKAGFGAGDTGSVQEVDHWRHFVRFKAAVVFGTIDPKTGIDPSGLYWTGAGVGKGDRAASLLTQFFKYLDELDGGDRATRFNPAVAASNYERLVKSAAYEYKRAKSLLGHTWGTTAKDENVSSAAASIPSLKNFPGEPARMSDAQFDALLQKGFDVSSHNGLRDLLIAILMNKAGLRESEALQLWTVDVIEDPMENGCALVNVIHPEFGPCDLVYRGAKYRNRGDYLRAVYGLEPRTALPSANPLSLGWKARFKVLRVWWFPTWWGVIFWRLWRRYLSMTASFRVGHPYAFIMENKKGWQPLAEDAYRKAFERAVFAAGLVPPGGCDMKAAGLTPHGGRHGYGNRAKNDGSLDKKVVMVLMHHGSDESQEVYTRKSSSQIKLEIAEAMKVMRSKFPNTPGTLAEAISSLPPNLQQIAGI